MDDQHRLNSGLNQHDARYNPTYLPNFNVSSLMRNASTSDAECQDTSGRLRHPYASHLPGLTFDPISYSHLQRGFVYPGFVGGLHQTGLNRINPALVGSTNDNNNCNRSRAASLSSAVEGSQPTASAPPQHLHMPPPYFPTFYDSHRTTHRSLRYPELPATVPNHHRRNSTTAVFPMQPDLHLIGASAAQTGESKLSSAQALQHYYRTHQYVLRTGGHLPPLYGYYESASQAVQGVHAPRRERYSVGGALSYGAGLPHVPHPGMRRRNSFPTALEAQQAEEEDCAEMSAAEDDDDDVFDAPGQSASSSRTDHTSHLEQLRESRKRGPSTGESSTSRAKYICRDEASANQPATPRARFSHAEHDPRDKDANVSMHTTTDDNQPGTSMQHLERVPTQPCTSTSESAETTQKQTPEKSLITSEKLTPPNARPDIRKSLTPSPILKKPRLKINRQGPLAQTNTSHGESSESSAQSTPSPARSKSAPPKKQVAWKDAPSYNSNKTPVPDSTIITPMNHDLLSEHNLLSVKRNPSAFTEKNKIGPYIFGPQLGTSPVRSISQYLVRKEKTLRYYMAKVLHMGGTTNDDRSGRMLLYSEHSLLTLLKNHPGVIRHHGFHKDVAYNRATGQARERLCLILDCLTQHNYDDTTRDYLNLQQHVIKVKRLTERETIRIFTSIVTVVHSLHELNVVHRDLKLGNMVLHCKTQKVILTNFCLGRHLMSDSELLKDQRGSPAYISPDVLSGAPYAGKPSDMWSLGVVLFMMLYGQFPFYDQEPAKLFKKIKKADFVIPSNVHTSSSINDIIRGLLTLDPSQRLTAADTLLALQRCANTWSVIRCLPADAQVVPDIDNEKESSDESDEDKSIESDHQRYEEEKLTRDFRMKMLSDDDESDSTENQSKGFSRLDYQSSLPSVRHVSYDARPLTQDEIALHRRLLANSSLGVRVQSTN